MKKNELKKFIFNYLVDNGILERGAFLDPQSTLRQLSLTNDDIENLTVEIEEHFGVTFDDGFAKDNTIEDILNADYE